MKHKTKMDGSSATQSSTGAVVDGQQSDPRGQSL